MNKKFLVASVVALLLGTSSVMADNHRHNDGPQKPKKEVVHKQDKHKKDKVSKNDRHFDAMSKHKAPKPVAKKAPVKPKPVAHAHRPHHRPEPKPVCRPDGRHGKSCHYCHSGHRRHCSHCRPVPPRRPVVKQVRITPPFSPIQVTVRI